jgi:hypothetical protein
MPKPIFIIRAPQTYGMYSEKIYELLNENLLNEYHVLVVHDSPDDEFRFHCFNSDLTDMDLETLKDLVMSSYTQRQDEAV